MTPFRYTVINPASGSTATVAAGPVITMSLPAESQLRYLWCFLEPPNPVNSFSAGYEAWVRFYRSQEMVMELPAALILEANNRIGLAGFERALSTINSTGTGGPDVLWWNTAGSNIQNGIHPIRLRIDADEVRLEHNVATAIRALLAVLSMSPA